MKEWMWGFLILSGAALFVGAVVYEFTKQPWDCRTVKEMGVCNRSGDCAVRFEDGSFGVAELPMVGRIVCRKHRRVFRGEQ